MISKLILQSFTYDNNTIQLYLPEPNHVQQVYQSQVKQDATTPAPYWTQIWPAALSMCQFLVANKQYIQNKKVLELAAGLGLPSLLASHYATNVCCSDYLQDAVDTMQQSIIHNKINNVESVLIDWNYLPQNITTDVLLLSDINYEPTAFETLYKVLQQFIDAGSIIILTTPQRIMAKPFIQRLMHWCIQQQEITVEQNDQTILTTALVLKKP